MIEDTKALFAQLDDRFPNVYNELLFLIGENFVVLNDDWNFCKTWLKQSVSFTTEHCLVDFKKRNARKLADCYCVEKDYKNAT